MNKFFSYILFGLSLFMALGLLTISIPSSITFLLISPLCIPRFRELISKRINKKIGLMHSLGGFCFAIVVMGISGAIEQENQPTKTSPESSSVVSSLTTKTQASRTPVPMQDLKSTPKPTATPTSNPTATPSPKPTATPTPKPTATPSPKPTATAVKMKSNSPIPNYEKQAAKVYEGLHYYLSLGQGMENARQNQTATSNCGATMRSLLPAVEKISKQADDIHTQYIKTAKERPFRYMKLASAGIDIKLCVTCNPSLAPRACKNVKEALKSYLSGEY